MFDLREKRKKKIYNNVIVITALHMLRLDVCSSRDSQLYFLFNLSVDCIVNIFFGCWCFILWTLNTFAFFIRFFLRRNHLICSLDHFWAHRIFNHKIKLSVKWYQNSKYKYIWHRLIEQWHNFIFWFDDIYNHTAQWQYEKYGSRSEIWRLP